MEQVPDSVLTRIGKQSYLLEFTESMFVAHGLNAGFSDKMAQDFVPFLYESKKDHYGTRPHPIESVYYRILQKGSFMCIAYEYFWPEQVCPPKNHKYDYEQIQVHFKVDSRTKEDKTIQNLHLDRIAISSKGSPPVSYHGVQLFLNTDKDRWYGRYYKTSPSPWFPWGEQDGITSATEVLEMPLWTLNFSDTNPLVFVSTCYHAFEGIPKQSWDHMKKLVEPIPNIPIKRLTDDVLKEWYFEHSQNQFGHDLSDPFEVPHLLYYPSPQPKNFWTKVWIKLKQFGWAFLHLFYSLRKH